MGSLPQILSVIVLLGLAVGGYLVYTQIINPPVEASAMRGGGGPRTVSVEVVPAEMRTLDTVLEAVGTTRALRSVDIVPHGVFLQLRRCLVEDGGPSTGEVGV